MPGADGVAMPTGAEATAEAEVTAAAGAATTAAGAMALARGSVRYVFAHSRRSNCFWRLERFHEAPANPMRTNPAAHSGRNSP